VVNYKPHPARYWFRPAELPEEPLVGRGGSSRPLCVAAPRLAPPEGTCLRPRRRPRFLRSQRDDQWEDAEAGYIEL